jgi:hypothetical protein
MPARGGRKTKSRRAEQKSFCYNGIMCFVLRSLPLQAGNSLPLRPRAGFLLKAVMLVMMVLLVDKPDTLVFPGHFQRAGDILHSIVNSGRLNAY